MGNTEQSMRRIRNVEINLVSLIELKGDTFMKRISTIDNCSYAMTQPPGRQLHHQQQDYIWGNFQPQYVHYSFICTLLIYMYIWQAI